MTSSTPAAAASSKEDDRLRTYLESKGLKFQLRAGNTKYECVVRDRASHEREKAARESSASSVTTSSTKSTSSTTSH